MTNAEMRESAETVVREHRGLMGECFECYGMLEDERQYLHLPPKFFARSHPCPAFIQATNALILLDTLGALTVGRAHD